MFNVEKNKTKSNNISVNSSKGDSGFLDVSVEESLLMTSEHERQSLNELNTRFAKYVEHIRKNDITNNNVKSIEEMSNIPSMQLENLRQLFEGEIKSLRDSLNQQSIDAAKLRIDRDKLAADKKNQMNELNDKCRMVDQLSENLGQSKAECETLRLKIDRLMNSKNDVSDLSKQLKECQNQLEREILLRTSADNACLTYKEKMEFNEAVFKKELGALLTTHRNAIRKLTSLQNNISSSNILEQMEEARCRLKDYLNELRHSIDDNLLKRIEKASSIITDRFNQHSNIAKQNETLSSDNNELMVQLEKLKASHIKLEDQLSDLEALHQEEINKLSRIISDVSSTQIDDLDERIRSLQEMNQSLGNKVKLDGEIMLYRKMIESEEDRTSRHSVGNKSPQSKRRKINQTEYSTKSSSSISTSQNDSRTILRASRHNKSCSIM